MTIEQKLSLLKRDIAYFNRVATELNWRMAYALNQNNQSTAFIETPIWEMESLKDG